MNVLDTKVVEMQFDNDQFQNGVEESISLLDKLEAAIVNTGRNIGTTALEETAGAITNSFNAMETAITTVIWRVTNAVVDMVSTTTSKLNEVTLDPIFSGFSKYESQVASVQTMMTATGKSIDAVTEQLDKLMWYTDETSYSYTQMADSVAKFVSAGVDLDDAVTAMIGISNWAGAAGVNATKANQAMYNLAQAMAKGSITAQDWTSINTANMSTHDFKETVVETAKEFKTWGEYYSNIVKTMKQDSNEFAAVVEKNGHTVEQVNKYLDYAGAKVPKDITWDTLTAENMDANLSTKWFTSDILMEVLKKYGNYTEDLYRIYNEGDYDTANDAIEAYHSQYDGIITDLYNTYAEYGKNSKEFRDIVNKNNMVMQTALDLIDSRKAEIYNANLNKVAENFSTLAKQYGEDSKELASAAKDAGYSLDEALDIVNNGTKNYEKVAKSRGEQGFANAQEAKTFTDAWGAAIEGASSQWLKFWTTVVGNYEEAKETWTDFSNVLWDIFAGPIYNLNIAATQWSDLGGRDELLKSIENLWKALNNLVDPVKNALVDVFPILSQYEEIGDIFYEMTVKFRKFTETLGLTTEQFVFLRIIAEGAISVFKVALEVLAFFWQEFGRIIDAILPKTNGIIQFLAELMIDLMVKLPKLLSDIQNGVNTVVNGIIQQIGYLKVGLSEVFETIKSVYYILTGNESLVKNNIFEKLETSGILERLRAIREAINNLKVSFGTVMTLVQSIDWTPMQKMFDDIKSVIGEFVEFAVRGLLRFIEIIIKVADLFTRLIARIAGFKGEWGETLSETLKSMNIFGDAFETVQSVIEKLRPIFSNIINVIKAVVKSISELISNINAAKAFMLYLGLSLSGFIGSIIAILGDFTWAIKDVFGKLVKTFDKKTLIEQFLKPFKNIKEGIANLFEGIASGIKEVYKTLQEIEFMKEVSNLFRSIGQSLLMIAGAAILLSSIPNLGDVIGALTGIVGVFGGLMFSMRYMSMKKAGTLSSNNPVNAAKGAFTGIFGSGTAVFELTTMMLSMSASLAILTVAITGLLKTINNMEHPLENTIIAIGSVGALLAMLFFMVKGLSGLIANPTVTAGSWAVKGKLGSGFSITRTSATSNAFGLIHQFDGVTRLMSTIALSLIPMTIAIRILGGMNIQDIGKGLFGISVSLLGLYLATQALIKVVASNNLNQTFSGANKFKMVGPNLAGVAGLLLSIAVSVGLLSVPVILIGRMDFGSWWRGLVGVAALGAMLTGFAALLIQLTKSLAEIDKATEGNTAKKFISTRFKLFEITTAMMGIATAITLLSVPVLAMGLLPLDKLIQGMASIIALMVSMRMMFGGILKATTGIEVPQILASAGSVLMMSGAIFTVCSGIVLIGGLLNSEQLVIGILGLTTAMVELLVLVKFLQSFALAMKADMPAKMLALAGSIALVGVAIDLIAMAITDMSLVGGNIGYGIVGLIFELIAVVTAMSVLSDITVEGTKLLAVGAGMAALGAGLYVIAQAMRSVAEMDFWSIVKSVIGLGAAMAIIAGIASGLSSLAGPIALFGLALIPVGAGLWLIGEGINAIHNALEGIADDPYVREFGDAIVETIMPALEKLWGWLEKIFNGIGEFLEDKAQKWIDFWEKWGASVHEFFSGGYAAVTQPDGNLVMKRGQKVDSYMATKLQNDVGPNGFVTEGGYIVGDSNTLGYGNLATIAHDIGYDTASNVKSGYVEALDADGGFEQIAIDHTASPYLVGLTGVNGFDSHSPARKLIEVGRNVVDGFVEGIKEKGGFEQYGKDSAQSYAKGYKDEVTGEIYEIEKLTRHNFQETVDVDEWTKIGMFCGKQYVIGIKNGIAWELGTLDGVDEWGNSVFTKGSYLEALRQAALHSDAAKAEISKYVTYDEYGNILSGIFSYSGAGSITEQWETYQHSKTNKEAAQEVRKGLWGFIDSLNLGEKVNGFLADKVNQFTNSLATSESTFNVQDEIDKFKSSWGSSISSDGVADLEDFTTKIDDLCTQIGQATENTYSFAESSGEDAKAKAKSTKATKAATSAVKDYSSITSKATELTNKYTTALEKLGTKTAEEESKLSGYKNTFASLISSTLGDTETLYSTGYESGKSYADGLSDGIEEGIRSIDAVEYTRQRNIVLNYDMFGWDSYAVQSLLKEDEKDLTRTEFLKLLGTYRKNVKETDDYVAQNGYNIAEANRLDKMIQAYVSGGISEEFKNYVIDDLIHSTDELKTDAEKKDQALEDLQSAIDNGYLKITMTDADIEKLNGAESSYKDVYAYLGKYAKRSYFQDYLDEANTAFGTMEEYLEANREDLYKAWTQTGDKKTFKQLVNTKGIDDAALEAWVQANIIDPYKDTKTEEKWEKQDNLTKWKNGDLDQTALMKMFGFGAYALEEYLYADRMNSEEDYYNWKNVYDILNKSWISDKDFVKTAIEDGVFSNNFTDLLSMLGIEDIDEARSLLNDIITNDDVVKMAMQYGIDSKEFERLMWIRGYEGADQADYKELVEEAINAAPGYEFGTMVDVLTASLNEYQRKKGKTVTGATTEKKATIENTTGNTLGEAVTKDADKTKTTTDTTGTEGTGESIKVTSDNTKSISENVGMIVTKIGNLETKLDSVLQKIGDVITKQDTINTSIANSTDSICNSGVNVNIKNYAYVKSKLAGDLDKMLGAKVTAAARGN